MDEFDYKEMMDRNQYFAELDEERIEALEKVNAELVEALRALRDQCDMNLPDPIPESVRQELRAADELLAKLETNK